MSTQSRLHPHRSSRPILPYIPGLDGLRAIAVVAVLLYHGQDLTGIPAFLKPQGGFLGVEMFFVISGFLITALLVREQQATERIDLKAFWIRRARRLLPALYLFLLGTIALAALFATDAFDKVRTEIFGALFYVSNWQLIATDESYFEARESAVVVPPFVVTRYRGAVLPCLAAGSSGWASLWRTTSAVGLHPRWRGGIDRVVVVALRRH